MLLRLSESRAWCINTLDFDFSDDIAFGFVPAIVWISIASMGAASADAMVSEFFSVPFVTAVSMGLY